MNRITKTDDKVGNITILELFEHNFLSQYCDIDLVKMFINDYVLFYDELRHSLVFLIKGVKIRRKKYITLAPTYVHMPIIDGKIVLDKVRFLQKLKPHNELMNETMEESLNLTEYPYTAFLHPHIDSTGYACWGYWHDEVMRHLDINCNPYAFIGAILGFLNDYNHDSTFIRINIDSDILNENGILVSNPKHFFKSLEHIYPNLAKTILKDGKDTYWTTYTEDLDNKFNNILSRMNASAKASKEIGIEPPIEVEKFISETKDPDDVYESPHIIQEWREWKYENDFTIDKFNESVNNFFTTKLCNRDYMVFERAMGTWVTINFQYTPEEKKIRHEYEWDKCSFKDLLTVRTSMDLPIVMKIVDNDISKLMLTYIERFKEVSHNSNINTANKTLSILRDNIKAPTDLISLVYSNAGKTFQSSLFVVEQDHHNTYVSTHTSVTNFLKKNNPEALFLRKILMLMYRMLNNSNISFNLLDDISPMHYACANNKEPMYEDDVEINPDEFVYDLINKAATLIISEDTSLQFVALCDDYLGLNDQIVQLMNDGDYDRDIYGDACDVLISRHFPYLKAPLSELIQIVKDGELTYAYESLKNDIEIYKHLTKELEDVLEHSTISR